MGGGYAGGQGGFRATIQHPVTAADATCGSWSNLTIHPPEPRHYSSRGSNMWLMVPPTHPATTPTTPTHSHRSIYCRMQPMDPRDHHTHQHLARGAAAACSPWTFLAITTHQHPVVAVGDAAHGPQPCPVARSVAEDDDAPRVLSQVDAQHLATCVFGWNRRQRCTLWRACGAGWWCGVQSACCWSGEGRQRWWQCCVRVEFCIAGSLSTALPQHSVTQPQHSTA